MAKVRLELETDLSQITSAFEQGDNTISQARAEVKGFATDAKAAFGTATGEAAKFEDEVKQGTEQLKKFGGASNELPKVPAAFKSIRQQIKELTQEAIKLRSQGDIIGADKAIKHAGELKDQLRDVQDAIKSVSGNVRENLAGGFRAATQIGLQGFEGIIAAQSLLGEKNEEFEKQLLRLQAVRSLSNIAREFGDIGDRIKEIKLAFGPLTQLYATSNAALKAFGQSATENIGAAAVQGKGFAKTFASDIKAMAASGVASMKTLWATIIANPLGILLTALTAGITLLVIFREKIADLLGPFRFLAEAIGLVDDKQEKLTKKVIANAQREEDAIKRRYAFEIQIAEATGKRIFQLQQQQTKDLEANVDKQIEALQKVAEKRARNAPALTALGLGAFAKTGLSNEEIKKLEELFVQREELQRQATVNLAKQQQSEKDLLKEHISDIETLRIGAIKDDQTRELAALKKKFNDDVDGALERVQAVFDNEQTQAEALHPVLKALEAKLQRDLQEVRDKYAKQRAEKAKQETERLLGLQKEFADAFAAITKRVQDGELENLFGEDRIARQRQIAIEEVNVLKDNLTKRAQAIEDFEAKMQGRKPSLVGLTVEQQEQFMLLEQQIYRKETEALIQLAVDRQNRLAEATTKNAQQTEANLTTEEANLIGAVQLAPRAKDTSEADFELEKQKAILEIQREYATKRLVLRQAALRAEHDAEVKGLEGELEVLRSRNDEDAQLRRIQITRSLELLDQKFNLENTKAQDETAKLVNDLQAQREKLGQAPPFNLIKFLGFTPEEFTNLQTTLGNVEQFVQQSLQIQLQAIDQEIANSQRRESEYERSIDSLQSRLEKEQELGEQGKANNANRIAAEIKQQEEAAAREKEIQAQALEERKRIQKQQILADSLTQASNIITASSQILATMAKDPVSVAIAFTTIGTMIAGFILSKSAALKAVESQKLKEGVIDLKGPGTETSDSIPAQLSRGESVMTARETKENKKILLGIRHRDKKIFTEGVMDAIAKDLLSAEGLLKGLLSGTRVTLPHDLPAQLVSKREIIDQHHITNNVATLRDIDKMRKEQEKTNEHLFALIKQGSERQYIDHAGNLVIKRGGNTTVIKKH